MSLARRFSITATLVVVLAAMGCVASSGSIDPEADAGFRQLPTDLLAGEVMAVAYSGFREGQHPDRGDGAVNPSWEETLEDLQILIREGFKLIRLYDSGENSKMVLEVIQKEELPMKVLLGFWL